MADIDFGELRVYPGNYDDFMMASTQARERMQSRMLKEGANRRATAVRQPLSALTPQKPSKQLHEQNRLVKSNWMKLKAV